MTRKEVVIVDPTANVVDGATTFPIEHDHSATFANTQLAGAPGIGSTVNSELIQRITFVAEAGDVLQIQASGVNNSWNAFGVTGTQTTEVFFQDDSGNFLTPDDGIGTSEVFNNTATTSPGTVSGAYNEAFTLTPGATYVFTYRSDLDVTLPSGAQGGTLSSLGTVNTSLTSGTTFRYVSVPESSSSLLGVLALSMGFLRRRR